MPISYPFPTGLYRAIGEDPVTEVAHDNNGTPMVVSVQATTAFERAVALVLLQNSPESFVVSHGKRYSPDGRVETCDPARPWYAGELHQLFDVEWVTLGPQPWIYVFTHTEQEWETARQAMKHLLQLGRLSPRSYLEFDHAGFDQGLLAQDLDGKPHDPELVARFRDNAICVQNEEEGWEAATDLYAFLMLATKERREQRPGKPDEEDDGWEGGACSEEVWTDEVELDEVADEDQPEEIIQEVSIQTSQRILSALARWRKGGNIFKNLR